jgi:hypothetical protein
MHAFTDKGDGFSSHCKKQRQINAFRANSAKQWWRQPAAIERKREIERDRENFYSFLSLFLLLPIIPVLPSYIYTISSTSIAKACGKEDVTEGRQTDNGFLFE